MVRNIDHVTVAVSDVDAAKRFFELLGFREEVSVTISGEKFATYMRIAGLEARHVTLVQEGSLPRFEIQLLQFLSPPVLPDGATRRLDRLGFNHICFKVDDIEQEIERLTRNGVELANDVMEFHDRKLVFLVGPEGITVELAQWRGEAASA
jgi:catechol 2,3-dioxygenase-like lactoylglutathione lyase family enzyme